MQHKLNDHGTSKQNKNCTVREKSDKQMVIRSNVRDPIKSVALNSILGELDESCLPKSISHVGEDIIFEYNVVEDAIDLDELDKIKDNPDALDIVASSFTEDEDAHEFLGIIAISHSNIVITYEGRKTRKTVSIRIPYSVLKKYCKVPQYLLS